MISVGVRELKLNLSRYLKRVKAGERILITDRKNELAIIVPYRIGREEEEILNLVQRSIAHWNGGKPAGMKSRIASRGKTVSDAVLEDRR